MRTVSPSFAVAPLVIAVALAAGCSKDPGPSPTTGSATIVPKLVAPQHPAPAAPVAQNSALTVRVLLAPPLAGQVGARDTVFVYARAAVPNGQVVALVKKTAGELPLTLTLDDAAALAPNQRLSDLRQVVVGARVSKAGDFVPRAGDFEGESASIPVNVNQTVVVAISRRR